MTNFTTIDDTIVDYGWRNDAAVADISRYRNLLLDVGVDGKILATYAVAIELIGERSYVCGFTTANGYAPAVVAAHMKEIAKGHAVNLGCGHC
jgi:hypothetical protein